MHFSKISRGSVCTLKFGKCCLRSISGGGGAQVIVALSHPERSGGSPFSSKPSPPCSDPRRRIQEAWTSLLPPLKGAEKKPKILMEQEQCWNETNKQQRKFWLLHVEICTALPWLPSHSEEKSKSSQQPARSCTTGPHHLPALISSILPLVHSAAAPLASSIFLKHMRHILPPGPLHLQFSPLECSSLHTPQRPTWFPPSLLLGLFSKVISSVRLLPPFPTSFFSLALVPKRLLCFSPLSGSLFLSPIRL